MAFSLSLDKSKSMWKLKTSFDFTMAYITPPRTAPTASWKYLKNQKLVNSRVNMFVFEKKTLMLPGIKAQISSFDVPIEIGKNSQLNLAKHI